MTTELLTTARLPSSAGRAKDAPRAFLIRIGRSHYPYDPQPLLVDLEGIVEASWGRGAEDSVETSGHRVVMTIDDPSLSTQHARLSRLMLMGIPNYMLEDLDSINGCLVNGVRIDQPCTLDHGDVVETGQTFWKFHHKPVAHLEELLTAIHDGGPITTSSSFCFDVLSLMAKLDRIAPSDIPVIISGETGTGKEMMAVNIHQRSGRPGAYVALNCAAIPEGLIESELFGHTRGAFTSAVTNKQGVIEAAHKGTLLLDEVGDMPPSAQAKLLRVLEGGVVVRVGETTEREVDVRFVAATNRDLPTMVDQGTFRGDLYARLNGFPMELPALRHRKEDLGILLAYFLLERQGKKPKIKVSHEVFRALTMHGWQFNIRELTKAVHVALTLLGDGDMVELEHLPAPLAQLLDAIAESREQAGDDLPKGASGSKGKLRLSDSDLKPTIEEALRQHSGNVAAVARHLDTSRMQVHRWMKKLGIDPNLFRG